MKLVTFINVALILAGRTWTSAGFPNPFDRNDPTNIDLSEYFDYSAEPSPFYSISYGDGSSSFNSAPTGRYYDPPTFEYDSAIKFDHQGSLNGGYQGALSSTLPADHQISSAASYHITPIIGHQCTPTSSYFSAPTAADYQSANTPSQHSHPGLPYVHFTSNPSHQAFFANLMTKPVHKILDELEKIDHLFATRQNDYNTQIDALKKAQADEIMEYMEVHLLYQKAISNMTGKTLEEIRKSSMPVKRRAKLTVPANKATAGAVSSSQSSLDVLASVADVLSSSTTSPPTHVSSNIPVSPSSLSISPGSGLLLSTKKKNRTSAKKDEATSLGKKLKLDNEQRSTTDLPSNTQGHF